MKKFLCALAFTALAFTSQAASPAAELFTYNESEVDVVMSELNELENYLEANEGMTLHDLQNTASSIDANLLSTLAVAAEPPLGIPSFLWGCGFGVLGIVLVHVVAEDKAETKKAFYGCITGTVVSTIVYIAVVASQSSK